MGTIKFEGELTVTLETAWASHIQNIGGTCFMGDLAGATYEPLQIYRDKEDKMVNYEPELLKGFLSEFESFHTAIRKDLPSPVPAEEVLNVAKIFDALYESEKIGRSVSIL